MTDETAVVTALKFHRPVYGEYVRAALRKGQPSLAMEMLLMNAESEGGGVRVLLRSPALPEPGTC